jgi:glycerophosphoryl diester phosphodiesterase
MEKSHPIIKTPLAHRGLHNEKWDENSIPAFTNAIAQGYGIELDVHLMKDGNIAVIHDGNLKRVTGYDVEIASLTKDELHRYPLIVSKTLIPLLEDVLTLVDGQVPLLVELKVSNEFNPDFALRVLEILKQYHYKNTVAVQSFNPYCVKFLRANQTMFPVGQLASDVLPGQSKFVHFMFKHLYILHISKPHFLNYEVTYIKKKKIARLRKKGMPIVTWTIDTLEKKAIAAKYADNIIFEKINL